MRTLRDVANAITIQVNSDWSGEAIVTYNQHADLKGPGATVRLVAGALVRGEWQFASLEGLGELPLKVATRVVAMAVEDFLTGKFERAIEAIRLPSATMTANGQHLGATVRCKQLSSVVGGRRCILDEGHAADDPTRFHRFADDKGVVSGPTLGGEDLSPDPDVRREQIRSVVMGEDQPPVRVTAVSLSAATVEPSITRSWLTEREITSLRKDLAEALRERDAHNMTSRLYQQQNEHLRTMATSVAPIPIRVNCPACHELHVDKGEFAGKPHHTHACQSCGCVWRPAVVDTVGVRYLPGFKDE